MKKILQEWKKWMMETKPTEKYFGQPTQPKSTRTSLSSKYDRAVPDTLRQADMRSTFKAVLKNFLLSNFGMGKVEEFNAKLDDHEKALIAKDLNVMRYIYMGRTNYKITDTNNVRTGVVFDNQPNVIGSPVEKIDAVLEDLDVQMEQSVPSDADIEEVYIYYVKPNYQAFVTQLDEPDPGKFASQMSWTPEKLVQMNKDLWLRNKRKK